MFFDVLDTLDHKLDHNFQARRSLTIDSQCCAVISDWCATRSYKQDADLVTEDEQARDSAPAAVRFRSARRRCLRNQRDGSNGYSLGSHPRSQGERPLMIAQMFPQEIDGVSSAHFLQLAEHHKPLLLVKVRGLEAE